MSEILQKTKKLEWKLNFDKIDRELKNLKFQNLKEGYNEIEKGLFENMVLDDYDILYGE